MFTGLVEAIGRIARLDGTSAGRLLRIETPMASDVRAGESVAVSGVCLTATHVDAGGFSAEVSPETMRVTSLGSLAAGDLVNLERPLRVDGRLGGHFVLGHVDGVGRITTLRPDADCYWLDVEFPAPLAPLLILKGSIAVDGISLTIAALHATQFGVQIVPFTWAHTTLQTRRPGDQVNLEADVIGKYVARIIKDQGDGGRSVGNS